MAELEPGLQYVDGEIEGVVIRALRFFHDQRGWLVETFRNDELEKDRWPTMMYISSTLPGVARGPHEHVDQTDGFAFIGPSDFRLYLWDSRPDSKTWGHRTVITVGALQPDCGLDSARRRPRLSQRGRGFRSGLQCTESALRGMG